MNYLLVILIILIIIFLFNRNYFGIKIENYDDTYGKLCTTCGEKNVNQCRQCFNCGFCVDQYGNGKCIGGDHKGPFNFEKCFRWYYSDPYSYMLQRNMDYKCNDGPRNSNRLIGI